MQEKSFILLFLIKSTEAWNKKDIPRNLYIYEFSKYTLDSTSWHWHRRNPRVITKRNLDFKQHGRFLSILEGKAAPQFEQVKACRNRLWGKINRVKRTSAHHSWKGESKARPVHVYHKDRSLFQDPFCEIRLEQPAPFSLELAGMDIVLSYHNVICVHVHLTQQIPNPRCCDSARHFSNVFSNFSF